MRRLSLLTAIVVGLSSVTAPVAASAGSAPPVPSANAGQVQKFKLYDGSTVEVGSDGMGWRTDASGRHRQPFTALGPQGVSALGDRPGPDRNQLIKQLSTKQHGLSVPGAVVVALSDATVDGARTASPNGHQLRAAHTTNAQVNNALRAVKATSMEALFGAVTPARIKTLSTSAGHRLGADAIDLSRLYVVHVTGTTAENAANRLRATAGVAYAEPNFYVSPMDTNPVPLPAWVARTAGKQPATRTPGAGQSGTSTTPPTSAASATADDALPTNVGLQSSLQSYLNASGVDLSGAYTDIVRRFGQIPGQGENITNVSLGDLTDQSMADAGDSYVQSWGPTTVVDGGQRYLDVPSMPRIPTYTVDLNGGVNPLGAVENVDPTLGEVLLDFSVMSPLPHDRQRPGAQGSGATDLLGIAPGANYRLVEPAQPTFANILTAMVAASQQTPKPDVITASLGYGTDVTGYAGRYLEDDPVVRSVVAGLVQHDGIVMTISANDGTRMYTPAAVGPDGGSTPTNLPRNRDVPTTVADDAMSTTPSVVPDSGAIDVGGTTLDDTVAVPPQSGTRLSGTGTFAESRLDGATAFSSGFGTRVNVSAPSDNIVALNHACCSASSAVTVLSGGTSASAPMTAAAAADVLQVARLTGHPMDPMSVRALLEQTGRAVATQPQIDRDLHVGPQIDVTRAVEKVLGGPSTAPLAPSTAIVRLSVAHRDTIGDAGANFVEFADPNAIDLSGPSDGAGGTTGEGVMGPITIGVDTTGVPQHGPVSYALRVGSRVFTSTTPSIRLLPAELLAAAGQPLVSEANRTITVHVEVRQGTGEVLATASQTLTFGPTDGKHSMVQAPVVAPVVAAGKPVPVRYDVRGLRAVDYAGRALLDNPVLAVSSVNHWSPFAAPMYRIAYSTPITADHGTVMVPASVFAAGGGVYGVSIEQNTEAQMMGAVAAFRVAGGDSTQRPAAPTIAASGTALGHQAVTNRTAPTFKLAWDAGQVAGATGATLEISAPGPTLFGLYNTFTNQSGSVRDNNGVDSGSSYFGSLPAVSGTATFDPRALGLQSSLVYAVRVIATKHGHPVGQASASSTLEYDDGLAPDGTTVNDFDVKPDGTAAVAATTVDEFGNPVDSGVYRYNPATATYGQTYVRDNTGDGAFQVFGVDPERHRMLAILNPWSGSVQHLLTYDTQSGQQVADVPIDAFTGYNILGGRLDEQRHEAELLAWAADGTDTILPVNMDTGTLGTPIPADNGTTPRSYHVFDVDGATGKVDLAGQYLSDLCVSRSGKYTTVDLNSGQAAPMTLTGKCVTGVAADQEGHAQLTLGPLSVFSGGSHSLLPEAHLQSMDESTGVSAPAQDLQAKSPIFPVVDPIHHVLVVAFLGGPDYQVNNNGMSAVGVYDLKTGAQISFSERFNLIPTAFSSFDAAVGVIENERGIQLDPATRTGWTYGPGDNQIEQFTY